MTTSNQLDLFGDEPAHPTAKNLRIVRQSRNALSKEQGSFNKLLSEVQRLQNKLAAWREFEQKQQQRVGAELVPLVEAVRQARAKFIKSCAEILEGRHGGDVPKKAERRHLTALVLEVCETYFAEPGVPDPEVIATFDAYSPVSHAEHQRMAETEFRDEARDLFGIDIPEDVDFDDVDEFLASAFASSADENQDEFAAEPKKSRKQKRSRRVRDGSDTLIEAVSVDPKRPLRDVYRKLASALHPDRGIDEADRNRRNELMQRVNAAYEGVDLLALLELQLEIQQIDEDHVASIPESVLLQYNQVLRDRVARLKGEISAVTDQFRMVMRAYSRSVTPAVVERDFEGALVEIRDDVDQLEEWASALRQTAYRKAWLKEWAQEKQADERRQRYIDPAVFFDDELADAMSVFFEPPGQSRGRTARGKRKRQTR
jgi:hypothetical protein